MFPLTLDMIRLVMGGVGFGAAQSLPVVSYPLQGIGRECD